MIKTSRPGMLRYVFIGFLMMSFSKGFEAMGDSAVLANGVGKGHGTPYFLLALILLLAGGACFVMTIRGAIRRFRWQNGNADNAYSAAPAESSAYADVFADERDFDPDAALSRYMQKRESTTPAPAVRGGFGRKGT